MVRVATDLLQDSPPERAHIALYLAELSAAPSSRSCGDFAVASQLPANPGTCAHRRYAQTDRDAQRNPTHRHRLTGFKWRGPCERRDHRRCGKQPLASAGRGSCTVWSTAKRVGRYVDIHGLIEALAPRHGGASVARSRTPVAVRVSRPFRRAPPHRARERWPKSGQKAES